jgi:hypothetical protein
MFIALIKSPKTHQEEKKQKPKGLPCEFPQVLLKHWESLKVHGEYECPPLPQESGRMWFTLSESSHWINGGFSLDFEHIIEVFLCMKWLNKNKFIDTSTKSEIGNPETYLWILCMFLGTEQRAFLYLSHRMEVAGLCMAYEHYILHRWEI